MNSTPDEKERNPSSNHLILLNGSKRISVTGELIVANR